MGPFGGVPAAGAGGGVLGSLTAAAPVIGAVGGVASGILDAIGLGQGQKLQKDQLKLQKELGRRQQTLNEAQVGRQWQQQAMTTPAQMRLLAEMMSRMGLDPSSVAMGQPLDWRRNPYYTLDRGVNFERSGIMTPERQAELDAQERRQASSAPRSAPPRIAANLSGDLRAALGGR